MRKTIYIILLFIATRLTATAGNHIFVSKKDLMLSVVSESRDTLFQCPIACGENLGNKTRTGDRKTPEGSFKITKMYDAT